MYGILTDSYSLIEYKNYRFLITNSPSNDDIFNYVQLYKYKHVVVLISVSNICYDTKLFIENGIAVINLHYEDNQSPNLNLIYQWMDIINKYLTPFIIKDNIINKPCIAIHCTSGLGKAPTLVAIALIELGMDNIASIQYIRNKSKRAFNHQQLNYIIKYITIKNNKYKCLVM